MEQAEQVARNVATNKWVSWLARFGYARKGVIYLTVGGLAVLQVLGLGGSATDQRGALQSMSDQPIGKVLLAVVAFGLLGFAIWSFVQALFDTEGKGHNVKGIVARIGYTVIGVSNGALALGAYQLVAGTGNGGQNSTSSTQDWTVPLLNQAFGLSLSMASYIFPEPWA